MSRALVLSGGGARGSFQAAAARVLIDHYAEIGDPVRIISGTSTGALNAAGIVAHGPEWAVDLWRRIRQRDVFRGSRLRGALRVLRGRGAIYDTRPLRRLIEAELDPADLAGSSIRLLVHAYCARTRRHLYWHNTSPQLLQGIYASAAIPVVFPTVRIGPYRCVDGGIVANIPVRTVTEYGARRITAIVLDHKRDLRRAPFESVVLEPVREPEPGRGLELADDVIDALIDGQFERDLYCAQLTNHTIRNTPEKLPGLHNVEIEVLRPAEDLGSALDFDRRHLDELLRLGERAAERFIASEST